MYFIIGCVIRELPLGFSEEKALHSCPFLENFKL
jgi:hypothetical protein